NTNTISSGFNSISLTVSLLPIIAKRSFPSLAHISASGNSEVATYIAIDDITLAPSCTPSTTTVTPGHSTATPPQTTTNPCPYYQFRCLKTNKCLVSSKRCDFHPDCGPNDDSDEHNCGNCDFEGTGTDSMCGWEAS